MKKYGLIGYPLSHSFSKRYFTERFVQEGIVDCAYENYPLSDISQVSDLIATVEGLQGLNVTIPYKEAIIRYLTHPDSIVQQIGACNCIKIEGKRLLGFNTDVYGFEKSLTSKLQAGDKRALILGTGGASKAVCFVLNKLNIEYLLVSRRADGDDSRTVGYEDLTEEIYASHPLIINTTPVGMHPAEHQKPPLDYDHITQKHFLFDLIYNPDQTLFLKEGAEKEARTLNGYDMLIYQAEKSWEIWTA